MTQQKLYLSASPAETERIAAEIAADVKRGDYIALFGEMGAGKTAFTRGLVGALVPECLPLVHSPTFAIVNEYRGADNTVYHFDLYRIQDEDDLYSTVSSTASAATAWSSRSGASCSPTYCRRTPSG